MTDNKALKFLHFNTTALTDHMKNKRVKQLHQSRTVAALALSPTAIRKTVADYLLLEAGQELHIPMAMGISIVSFDDNYSRQAGRDTSVKAMAEIDVKVNSVNANDTHIYVNLAAVKGIELTLRLNRKTGFSSVLGQIVGPAR